MLHSNVLSRWTKSAADTSDHKDDRPKQQTSATGLKQSRHLRYVLLGLGIVLAASPLVAPRPALAWWGGGVWVGGPAYVAPRYVYVPPPVVYAPLPVAYAPPVARWIPGHYNWRGFWIPGHWVG